MAAPRYSVETAPTKSGHERDDSMSVHSDSPLNVAQPPTHRPAYPPSMSSAASSPPQAFSQPQHVRIQMSESTENLRGYPYSDAERANTMPEPGAHGDSSRIHRPGHGGMGRSGSWDLLAGIKKFEHSYEEFHTRNASEAHLVFAEGDIPNNRFARFYNYLLNVSIVTRWFLFIVPVMGILWIPGILGLTTFPKANIWAVKLVWWSIWLSVIWGGWWAALAFSMILPGFARNTVGLVAVGARRYIDWLGALHRYVALFGWSLANWISFQPLIITRKASDASDSDVKILSTIAKLLFGFFLCSAVLVGEKFAIQFIAGKFHERSYAERIADQKFAVRVLSILYRHSSDIPGRADTLRDGPSSVAGKRASVNPRLLLKKAFKGVREAATTTTTALGNVASEIAGSSVLQPNSPQAKVQVALESANKSRALARRLFYSFARPHSSVLLIDDVARFFASIEDANAAFALFDKDCNGDATRDEVEMACLEFHREQLSIEHSMRDLDSAVGRLDNILMSLYFVVAILIMAVCLETQLVSLITGAGTLFIGLSWLIGSSLQEVLESIIFLFVKHPYDVGDRVVIDEKTYTVKEIRLLSTIFLDSNACCVQAPHKELNDLFIANMRRSSQMSETITIEVAYSTTFEQIQRLQHLMLSFVTSERRDFRPEFDIIVDDIPGQTKMVLKADIKYKSNWQQGNIRAIRRNKWLCALKGAMKDAGIFGPDGDPGAKEGVKEVTLVPWEEVREKTGHGREESTSSLHEPRIPTAWTFTNQNSPMIDDSEDVFGDKQEIQMANNPNASFFRQRQRTPQMAMPSAISMPSTPVATMPGPGGRSSTEEIELRTPRGDTFKLG